MINTNPPTEALLRGSKIATYLPAIYIANRYMNTLINENMRRRNSELGRWMSVDPLASKYPSWSPYNYALGNPVNLIDPDGMEVLEGGGDKEEEKQKAEEYQIAKDELFVRLWEGITHEIQNKFQNLSTNVKEAANEVYNTVYGEGPGFLNVVSDGIAYGGLFVGSIALSAGQAEFGLPVITGSFMISTKLDMAATSLTGLDYAINGGEKRAIKFDQQLNRIMEGAAFGKALGKLAGAVKVYRPIYLPIIF